MNLPKQTTAWVVIALALGTAGCNNDATITGRVKMAIASEPGLKETKVNVSTEKKVVHLSGTVKSRDERAALIATARKVDGVKAVKTDLVVQEQQKTAAATRPVATRRTATEAKRKPEQRAQLKSTPPGPGVPPER